MLLLLGACLLTCMGQVSQKFAVEGWRDQPDGWAPKLRSPWLWSALVKRATRVTNTKLRLSIG